MPSHMKLNHPIAIVNSALDPAGSMRSLVRHSGTLLLPPTRLAPLCKPEMVGPSPRMKLPKKSYHFFHTGSHLSCLLPVEEVGGF